MDRTFTEVLASRRMCRDFEATTLASGTAESLVDAATRAPAAGNTHALDFVVLEGPQTSLYWDTTLAQHRRDGFRWPGLLRAPMLLVAYVEPGAYVRRYSEPDKAHSGLGDDPGDWAVPYWYVDGGAAVMAVLLAAETLGLGSLLFGQFGHEQADDRVRPVEGPYRVSGDLFQIITRESPDGIFNCWDVGARDFQLAASIRYQNPVQDRVL